MPTIAAHTHAPAAEPAMPLIGNSFLEVLTIDHGPMQLLGRFFAAADAHLVGCGLSLRLCDLDDVFAAHLANKASWASYPPMLNPKLPGVGTAETFGIVCQTDRGLPVAAIGGRIYRGMGTLADCVASQRFLYGESTVPGDGPRLETWATRIAAVTSPFSYIGALWVHPSYRGYKLARLLPPVTRGYALARWNISHDVGLASETMAQAGIADVYGYTNMESGFRAVGLGGNEHMQGAFLWMNADEIVDHTRAVLVDRLSQVDTGIVDRAAHKYA